MGNKQPAIFWYIGDWFKDPEVSMCKTATRAIWLDALFRMHERRQGFVKGTIPQLCRMLRCTTAELKTAINEIQNLQIGGAVMDSNKIVTIRSRRKTREFKELELNRLRVNRHRKKHKQTEKKRDCNGPSSYSSSNSITSSSKSTAINGDDAGYLREIFIEECCPSLPLPVKKISKARINAIISRFKDLDQDVSKWREFCKKVQASDFLCGRTDKPFSCGIDWILKPANFAKIIEGNYDNKKPFNKYEKPEKKELIEPAGWVAAYKEKLLSSDFEQNWGVLLDEMRLEIIEYMENLNQ